MKLKDLAVKELLQLQAAITNELVDRKVVRTQNNPLGDYTEWLVANALGLVLESSSKAGFDGISRTGVRIQIKGRRMTGKNKSPQLSAIRKYAEKDFDELIAVIFNADFDIIEARQIPHEVVGEYATYREHVNAHILTLKGPIMEDSRVRCIKHLLCN